MKGTQSMQSQSRASTIREAIEHLASANALLLSVPDAPKSLTDAIRDLELVAARCTLASKIVRATDMSTPL